MFKNSIKKLNIVHSDIESRLDSILVDGQADNGSVKVVVDGNKVVQQILISQELFDKGDKENVEELTIIAINKALKKVEIVYNDEVEGVGVDNKPE